MACAQHFIISVVIAVAIFGSLQAGDLEFEQHEGECKKLNNDFISSHNEFTQCVLKRNRNIDARESYCYGCLKPYHRLVHNYTSFANGHTNVTGYNDTCRSLYFDTNQLNLVETVYKNALQLYDVAFCKDCFNKSCEWGNSGSDCTKSETTIAFEVFYNQTLDCIVSQSHKRSPCDACNTDYENLNKKYDNIRLKSADKFCFDIKNMMNQTRIKWSEDLHCCADRTLKLFGFWITTSLAVALTIVFYLFVVVDTRRSERVQYIPNDLMPYDRNALIGSQETVNASDANMPGPSSSNISTSYHQQQFQPEQIIGMQYERAESDGDHSDDDDNIDIPLPQTIISLDE